MLDARRVGWDVQSNAVSRLGGIQGMGAGVRGALHGGGSHPTYRLIG